MRAILLGIVLMSVGCASSPRIHIEGGIAFPELGGQSFIRDTDSLRDLHAGLGALHVESTALDLELVAIDVGIGPSAIVGHQGHVVGGEVMARVRVQLTERFQPYVIGTVGIGYADGWSGSDVDYTYTTGLGVGAQFKFSESVSLMADWRWVHHSNGMTFHSDSFRDLIGQKKASRNHGYQNGAIMVGVQFEF